MSKQRINIIGSVSIFFVVLIVVISFFIAPRMFATQYQNTTQEEVNELARSTDNMPPQIRHVRTPDVVKAIYMTACVAGTPSIRERLIALAHETEINSIVIDIKDFSGTISFPTSAPELVGVQASGCKANDMKDLVQTMHDAGIYVIGRVTVFQDPFYTKLHPDLAVQKNSDKTTWKDFKGISFIDVSAQEYWEYILLLAKESHQLGFDEINFDYIRFPSDGNMKDIYFPHSNSILVAHGVLGKQIALENFFKYLSDEISAYNKDQEYPLITSADLFGMVTTNTDDLNIGQVLERALPYFDYIAPMVYPSHYPPNFNGWKDPNDYPYDLIHFVMSSAVDRVEALDAATTTPAVVRDHVSVKQLRPWLQDFDYGGNYDVAEVRAQIQATYDSGLDSWMLWAPSNRYTRGALQEQ